MMAAAAGCGKKETAGPPTTWTNGNYHLSVTYPGKAWKTKDLLRVDDPKRGIVTIVLFARPTDLDHGEAHENPPMVTIKWIPSSAPAGQNAQATGAAAPLAGAQQGGETPNIGGAPTQSGGITYGWVEFQAQNVKNRQMQWTGGLPAEEATAIAKAGTPFFTEQTNGQLVGPDMSVRVVQIRTQAGTYEIARVAPADKADILAEGDGIVNSIRLTQ